MPAVPCLPKNCSAFVIFVWAGKANDTSWQHPALPDCAGGSDRLSATDEAIAGDGRSVRHFAPAGTRATGFAINRVQAGPDLAEVGERQASLLSKILHGVNADHLLFERSELLALLNCMGLHLVAVSPEPPGASAQAITFP